ncbi:DUF397 domain-containing protein [Streptomyces sp. UNOC14_S4]|uniref:DUF397 domain-containing protein n=1 Tax=Streptomyces sp. UNOC14_S4 TaxID=2872340 RepID=UPI001E64A8CA|nr:DUF397 domain-containing protein [Streptomyces sp. UNOC14_S4]MCC3769034.1 DUF397 domain-containing protein [Streptomyces sp. UNOC14_S4]
MNRHDPIAPTWWKSSYSNAQSSCVEVSDSHPGVVPVRDSKTPDTPGPNFPTSTWETFVADVKHRR